MAAWLACEGSSSGSLAAALGMLLPRALLAAQLTLGRAAHRGQPQGGMANSAELLADIEAYHAQHGAYPASLAAVWQDYAHGVVGISRYHYEAKRAGYNLLFEQPSFFFDHFGAREFVVYNPLGEHSMVSHVSWILL